MRLMFFFLLIFNFVTSKNACGTSIEASDTITVDSVWDSDTVNITGDIIIKDSVTLTIQPRTNVRFMGLYKIEVNGRILAVGTPENKIVFTSEDTTGYYSGSDIGWAGIILNNPPITNDSSKIEYCIISFCKSSAIDVQGKSKLSVSNNEIMYNEIGISISDNSTITINNNTIMYNRSLGIDIGVYTYDIRNTNSIICNNQISWNMGAGIQIYNCENLLISHNVINNNQGQGIWVIMSYYSISTVNNIICKNSDAAISNGTYAPVLVSRSTICYNGEGLDYHDGECSYNVENSILWNYGIKYSGCPVEILATWHLVSAYASYCLIQGGLVWKESHPDGTLIYDHIISDEPEFVDAENDDYSLSAKSPCINRGKPGTIPSGEVDIAGNSRCIGDTIDIGAYEFINKLPRLTIPLTDYQFYEDSAFIFSFPDTMFIDDNFGDSLAYQAKLLNNNPLPAWLQFDAAKKEFSGKAFNEDVGTDTIVLSATDLFFSVISDTFTLTVTNTNDSPVLNKPVPDQIAIEDTPFYYTLPDSTFIDPDTGDNLHFRTNIAGGQYLPAWLSFDSLLCTFTGTPHNNDVGITEIVISAIDDSLTQVSDTFTLTIINTNDPPVLNKPIPDQIATEDTLFYYTLPDSVFLDPDVDDSLCFSAFTNNMENLPQWLVFDSVNLLFHGTPMHSDIGILNILIMAEDLYQISCADTFIIVVESNTLVRNYNNHNRKLVIYPNPSSGIINIHFKGNWEMYADIRVYDIKGRVCFSEKDVSTIAPYFINFQEFKEGYYFIETFDKKYREICGFIIE